MNPVVPRSSRLRSLMAVLLLSVGVVLCTATAAQAHTALASANPAEGSTVTEPLPTVELTFTGRVLLREVTVTGPAGASAAAGEAAASGAVVSQPVTLDAAGTYTVGYAITAGDGHQLDGSLTFTYAPPAPPSSAAPTTPSAAPSVPDAAAAPGAAEASEASAGSAAPASDGAPVWLVAVLAVLVVAAAVLAGRRLRSRR